MFCEPNDGSSRILVFCMIFNEKLRWTYRLYDWNIHSLIYVLPPAFIMVGVWSQLKKLETEIQHDVSLNVTFMLPLEKWHQTKSTDILWNVFIANSVPLAISSNVLPNKISFVYVWKINKVYRLYSNRLKFCFWARCTHTYTIHTGEDKKKDNY